MLATIKECVLLFLLLRSLALSIMTDNLYRSPSQVLLGNLPPREHYQRSSKAKSVASSAVQTDDDDGDKDNANSSDSDSSPSTAGSVADGESEVVWDIEEILDSDWEGHHKVCI